jgi:hypothetical protein
MTRVPEFRKPSAVSRKPLADAPAMESEPSALTGVELFIISPEFGRSVHVLKARVARASTLTSTSTSPSDGLTIAADALKTAYETDSELTAFTTLCIDEYRQNG